jgi:protein-disulfide isomerase
MKHWVTFLLVFLIIVFFIVAYSISNDPYSRVLRESEFIGEDNASIVVVEFGDYLDPVSRQNENNMKRLRMDYDVKFIYKHFVNSNQSTLAAMSAKCAGNQGLFEEMHDKLYAFRGDFGLNATHTLADEIPKLKIEQFKQCILVDLFSMNIEKDFELGSKLGVSYLPVVFIDGKRFEGLQDYSVYSDFINQNA